MKANRLEETCSICLDPMSEEVNTTTLDCRHRFHTQCLRDAFRINFNVRCPECRGSIRSQTISNLLSDSPEDRLIVAKVVLKEAMAAAEARERVAAERAEAMMAVMAEAVAAVERVEAARAAAARAEWNISNMRSIVDAEYATARAERGGMVSVSDLSPQTRADAALAVNALAEAMEEMEEAEAEMEAAAGEVEARTAVARTAWERERDVAEAAREAARAAAREADRAAARAEAARQAAMAEMEAAATEERRMAVVSAARARMQATRAAESARASEQQR